MCAKLRDKLRYLRLASVTLRPFAKLLAGRRTRGHVALLLVLFLVHVLFHLVKTAGRACAGPLDLNPVARCRRARTIVVGIDFHALLLGTAILPLDIKVELFCTRFILGNFA